MRRSSGAAFIALGVVFLYMGLGNRSSYIGLGIAFLVIGLAVMRRRRG